MPEDCVSQDCCPNDPYAYRSVSAEDSLAGTHNGCIPANVTFEPVSGSYVFFPSYIVLTADNEDAEIRYTTDGTDPDEDSELYTGPIEITQAATMIKARAFVEDCSPGPVVAALYQNPPFALGADYSCTTPDKGGTWDVWAPNGTIDHFWRLEFVLTGNQSIKRVEVRQLNASGVWDTGIIYSTDSPLEIDGEDVDVMPLLLFIGGVQQHTDYQASLGTFGAATHTWDLYGDKQFPAEVGYFQFTMVLEDDSRLTAIHTVNCSNSVDPTPCPSPAAPTATALCDGAVDLDITGTLGQNYKVYYSAVGTPGGWTLFMEDSINSPPTQTVNITGLTPGQLYYFRVELEYSGCGYQSSIPVQAVPLPDPEVLISSDKLTVDPNESFTISWNSTYIGGAVCGGCLDGQVSINQGLGCKAGNAAGSQATSQATPGTYTYEITGCNACGTVTASVQVEVRNVATCGVQPATVSLANPATFLCGELGACSYPTQPVAWNGQFALTGSCQWSNSGAGLLGYGCIDSFGGYIEMAASGIVFSTNKWVLTFTALGQGTIWQGEKTFGNSPLGTYTRTGGCATGPATLTIT